jgi:ABC-type nitrate/sulfonate/bicarbonate transport system permease component
MKKAVSSNSARPSVISDDRTSTGLAALYARHYNAILGSTGVALALVLWEWAGTSGAVNPLFISAPSRIVRAFIELSANGELLRDVIVSGKEFIYGFFLAIIVGVPLGILMGWYRPVKAIFDPFVSIFNATPRVALLPLIIIWLGIGINSKIALVFSGALIAILLSTIAGVENLDASLIRAARSFGASDFQIFRTIALPGTVPFLITGMRLGLGHALVGVVVGELYAATAGIGFLIAVAGNTFQTDKVFVGVVIVAFAGLVFTGIFNRVEAHFQSWKPKNN